MFIFTHNTTEASTYSKTFKDVSPKNTNHDIINAMAERGVISGYEDGTFRPGEFIKRKQAATLISRAFPKLIKGYEWREMNDLSPSNPYYNDIKRLYEGNLLNAEEGFIRPNDYLTRLEMARIIAYVYGLYDDSNSASNKVFNHPFTDLRLPHDPLRIVSNRSVAGLYNNSVTTGFEDKTFRASEPLTRAQFAVFMYRADQKKHENAMLVFNIEPFKYSSYEYAPLPEGYNNAQSLLKQQSKEYGRFSYNNNFDYRTGKNMHISSVNYQFSELLTNIGENLKIDADEVVRIINHVFTTGEVYTSPPDALIPFALYYDFTNGFLYYGSDV